MDELDQEIVKVFALLEDEQKRRVIKFARSLLVRRNNPLPLVFAGVLILFLSGWLYTVQAVAVPPTPVPSPTSSPLPTFTPQPSAYSQSITPVATPSCYRWNEITVFMQGKTVCVYGLIKNLHQDNSAWTRYEFSDIPNTFFLYSKDYEFFDPVTGKTITSGDCIQTTGVIQTVSLVPYMDITDVKGNFSHSSTDCQ